MKTPEPKYLLREPKSKEKTPIHFVARYDNKKFVYNTGEKVLPKNWDYSKMRVKKATSFPNYADINYWLNKLENDIVSIFRELRLNMTEIDNTVLKQKRDEVLGKNENKKVDLLSFIEHFIESNKNLKSEGTIKVYQITYNHLKKFQDRNKIVLTFKSIDLVFYNKFIDYFLNELSYSSNIAGKYLKTLKVFLNEATERGINKTTYYISKR